MNLTYNDAEVFPCVLLGLCFMLDDEGEQDM